MKKTVLAFILIGSTMALLSCSSPTSATGPGALTGPGTAAGGLTGPEAAPARPEPASNPQINIYLTRLKYDPRQLLAEQNEDSVIPAQPLPDETQDDGQAIITVKRVKHHLSGNIEDVSILNPNQGVIWPGSLVTVDDQLVRGTPMPVALRRAPMWLSVDLPGIGGRGVFQVENPSQGTVQAAIDGALDYWNNNQYQQGYVSEARSKYTATVVYNAEQLAASLGISYHALQGSLATQFRMTSAREKKVAVALFKQVFYTVSFEPPVRPGAMFDPGVTLDEVREGITAEMPAAYVSSVDYGRILMLRIETSAETLDTELEAAARYLGAKATASAEYKQLLANSKIDLITIGGNAAVNTRAVSARQIDDLYEVIQGKNALYSKSNPGQPISYTIRFLRDGRLAKMGYSTDYTELVCERKSHGWIGFKHRGAYVAKIFLSWKEGDTQKQWKSNQTTSGWDSEQIPLKATAHDIHVVLQSKTGLVWEPWRSRTKDFKGPPNKFLVAKGTTLHPSLEE